MLVVAALAARVATSPGETITATRSWTRSAANAGSRLAWFPAQRYSMTNFAGLVQTPPEAGQPGGVGFRRREVQIPDHRHRRLLRARRKRPSGYTAAEKCDEFPPPHGAYPKAKDHELIIAPCIAAKSGPSSPSWVTKRRTRSEHILSALALESGR
jgi:hypothetical protein